MRQAFMSIQTIDFGDMNLESCCWLGIDPAVHKGRRVPHILGLRAMDELPRHQRGIVGRAARMRSEKSDAPSAAACATSLTRERRRNSSNGSVVSIRPER